MAIMQTLSRVPEQDAAAIHAWPPTNSTLLQVELLGRFDSQGGAARCYDCMALKRAGPSCSSIPLNFSIHDYALLQTGDVVVAPAGHQAAAQHADRQLGSASATSLMTPAGTAQRPSIPAGMPSAAEKAKARHDAAQHASHPRGAAVLATGAVGRQSSHQMGSLQGGSQLALGPTQPQHSSSSVRGHTDSMGALQNASGASLGSCGTMAPAPFAAAAVAASQGPLAQVCPAACGSEVPVSCCMAQPEAQSCASQALVPCGRDIGSALCAACSCW